jgi:methyl-accepting chemotaxis protein
MTLRLKLIAVTLMGALTIMGLSISAEFGAVAFKERLSSLDLASRALRNHTNGDMKHDALRSDVYAALFASVSAPQRRDEVLEDTRKHADEFKELIRANKMLDLPPEVSAALTPIETPLRAYIEIAQELTTTAFKDHSAAAAKLPHFDNSFETLEKAMEVAGDEISRYASEATQSADTFAAAARWLAMVGIGIGLTVSAASLWLILRGVLHPLHTITSAMTGLATGKLDLDVPVRRKDEIGAMSKALVHFRDAEIEKRRLEEQNEKARRTADEERSRREAERAREVAEADETISNLARSLAALADGNLRCEIPAPFAARFEPLRQHFNSAMSKLNETLSTIVTTARAIDRSTDEIAQASDDLARRTEQQAMRLEMSAGGTSDVLRLVNETASSSTKTKDVITSAKKHADATTAVVRNAVEAMSGIRGSSSQISSIISTIDEIAFQTNLLALNAGVEAARAGDSGRGFAVVASEVRALAQRSAMAAKEIKDLITASTGAVEDGANLVGQTGTAIERIISEVAAIDGGIADIADRSMQQASALREVNSAISELDRTTQENAAMAEQATSACKALSIETERLVVLVSFFSSGEESAPRQPARTDFDDSIFEAA